MAKQYLFDASAVVNMVKRGAVMALAEGCSLDLTVYEALNAVWKESVLLGRIDSEIASKLVENIVKVLSVIGQLTIKGVEEKVYETAVEEELTIYDASYILVAAREGLTLVTDDEKLLDKASKHVPVVTSRKLLELHG